MKEYIATLHKKPRAHKKRFALLVAGSATLIIFALWSMVTFATPKKVVDNTGPVNLAAPVVATTPFEDIVSGIKSSWDSLSSIVTNGGK